MPNPLKYTKSSRQLTVSSHLEKLREKRRIPIETNEIQIPKHPILSSTLNPHYNHSILILTLIEKVRETAESDRNKRTPDLKNHWTQPAELEIHH